MVEPTPTPTPVPSPSSIKNKGKTKSPEEIVKDVSDDAINSAANAPGVTQTGKSLTGVPLGTDIRVGKVRESSPEIVDGKVVSIKTPVMKKTQYSSESPALYFASLTTSQRAELLLNLGSIPGLYAKNTAPSREYVLAGLSSKQLGARPEDLQALENVMYYSDTVGEDVAVSIKKFVRNPSLAQSYFDIKGTVAKKAKLTPSMALATELDQSLRDFLEVKATKENVKEYTDRVNKLETSLKRQLGVTERQQILTDFIQDQARKMFAAEADDPESNLTRKGALGGTFNYLRQVRNEYGVQAPDSVIYKEAIRSIRSKQALDNIVNKIQLQAEINMPALKSYFQQGLNAREALGNYISLKSRIYGIPEEQITLDSLSDVYAGTNLMPLKDFENLLFKSPEFKGSPLYKQQQMSDYRTLVRNFLGQAGYGATIQRNKSTP